MNDLDHPGRLLARNAAILMLLGLLTGIYVAAAMTGKVPADPHTALAAHIGALLGSFWLLAVAFTMPMLRFGAQARARLALTLTIATYSNWFITAVKAWLKVSGVDYIGDVRNDLVFGLLNVLVVLPALAATGAWVYGLSGKRPAT